MFLFKSRSSGSTYQGIQASRNPPPLHPSLPFSSFPPRYTNMNMTTTQNLQTHLQTLPNLHQNTKSQTPSRCASSHKSTLGARSATAASAWRLPTGSPSVKYPRDATCWSYVRYYHPVRLLDPLPPLRDRGSGRVGSAVRVDCEYLSVCHVCHGR